MKILEKTVEMDNGIIVVFEESGDIIIHKSKAEHDVLARLTKDDVFRVYEALTEVVEDL
jgi:hypothetical protein